MISHTIFQDQRLFKAAIFLFTAVTFFSSCKKEETDLGLDVLPGDDQLNMLVDTLEVNSYIETEDTLHSDELSSNLLGSYNDPVFGKTDAGFYSQVRLSAFNPAFDIPNTTVDSVVLSMKISGHYGNETSQTFKVYTLTEDIYIDSTYYIHTTKTTDLTDLVKSGYGTFTPSLTNQPVIDGDTLDPQIRLRLNESFGNMIINASPADLADETAFAAFFKGIYVSVDNPSQMTDEGGVYSLDLEDAQSKITIYYHDLVDTTKYELLINDKCARFTHVEHDYTGTVIGQQLADSTLGNTFYYLQAGQGVAARLYFPDLFSLLNEGNIIINKAELYLPVQYYTIDPYSPPSRIMAYGVNSAGVTYSMPDVSFGLTVFGGNFDSEKKSYKFNILRYIQDVLRGDVENIPIKLSATAASVSVNRAILSGKNSPNREKPFLKVYYTKY